MNSTKIFASFRKHFCALNKFRQTIHTAHDLSAYRSLVRIGGEDSAKYLQNLITNDIKRLSSGECRSLYAMMLNERGRVMYDVIVYKLDPKGSEFLIEVDRECLPDFLKMLKIFKIKKKVSITSADDDLQLGALTNLANSVKINNEQKNNVVLCESDPRYSTVGYRVILNKKELKFSECFEDVEEASLKVYKQNLYKHGIGENYEDINYGSAIPLEYNVVLMNGVAFDKGCYLGQELIAKTHFTGVIRKRITPICLKEKCDENLFEKEAQILNSKTVKSVGKLKNLIGKNGIAMLRVELLDKENLVMIDKLNKPHALHIELPEFWKNDENLLKTINELKLI